MNPKPPVYPYYLAYVIFMALLYLGVIVMCVGLLVATGGQGMKDEDMVLFLFMPACSLPFLIAYAAAPFLPPAPWAWTYHLVLIAVGLTSACCMPIAIPLLIFWLKPETKAYFGKA